MDKFPRWTTGFKTNDRVFFDLKNNKGIKCILIYTEGDNWWKIYGSSKNLLVDENKLF